MSTEAFGLRTIGQISVAVEDVERSVRFYRDVLGMAFLVQGPGMAFFDCDGVRLFLTVSKTAEFSGTSTLYFRVSSMHDAVKTLERRGVQFTGKPHVVHQDAVSELWMVFFRDPDGNLLALMTEVPQGTV